MYYNTINSSEEVEKTSFLNEYLRLLGQAEKLWRALSFMRVIPKYEAENVIRHLRSEIVERGNLDPALLLKLSSYIICLQNFQKAAYLAKNLVQDQDSKARSFAELLSHNSLQELDRFGLQMML